MKSCVSKGGYIYRNTWDFTLFNSLLQPLDIHEYNHVSIIFNFLKKKTENEKKPGKFKIQKEAFLK
jgi:hypothetical protein